MRVALLLLPVPWPCQIRTHGRADEPPFPNPAHALNVRTFPSDINTTTDRHSLSPPLRPSGKYHAASCPLCLDLASYHPYIYVLPPDVQTPALLLHHLQPPVLALPSKERCKRPHSCRTPSILTMHCISCRIQSPLPWSCALQQPGASCSRRHHAGITTSKPCAWPCHLKALQVLAHPRLTTHHTLCRTPHPVLWQPCLVSTALKMNRMDPRANTSTPGWPG